MAKQTITNTAEGPRGVALADGTTLYIEPGQTAEDVDVAEGHKLYEGLTSGDAAEGPAEPGPLDGSIDELTAHAATLDNVDDIDALIAAETAGKSRKGALSVLEARKAELAGE